MSTTANTPARLVAEALIREAANLPEHGRLHAGELFDVQPAAIFAELSGRLSATAGVPVSTPGLNLTLAAVPLTEDGRELLVPYLVGNPGTANQGSAGYAAVLRDEVPVGEGKKVLLILDTDPVETVRTTSRDASTLPGLQWERLVAAALGRTAGPVFDAVLADSERLRRTSETLGELMAMAKDPAQAGSHLQRLGIYIRDPEVAVAPAARLKKSVKWRERLESWSAPDKDTRSLVRAEYPTSDDARAERVVAAIGPFGVDYDSFDLDDLPDLKHSGRLAVASPPRTRGTASVNGKGALAAWVPGGGTLTVVLTGRAGRDVAEVRWSNGHTSEGRIESDARDLTFDLPAADEDGWLFGAVAVNGVVSCRLAVCTASSGTWFPVEARLDIDTEEGAFEFTGSPEILCVDAKGRILGAGTLDGQHVSEGRALHSVVRGTEKHAVWLFERIESTADDPEDDPIDDPEDPPEADPTDPPVDGPADDPIDDPLEPEPTTPGKEAFAYAAFARLADARSGKVHEDPTFAISEETAWVQVSTLIPLKAQTLTNAADEQWNGFDLEAHVLTHPTTLTWELNAPGETEPLTPDRSLERLVLDDLDQHAVAAFTAARTTFFEALAPYGSVHALGVGLCAEEATAYVDSYQELIASIDRSGSFRAELERLILCDAVTDPSTGHIYLAPSNPVTVAFMLQLNETVEGWLPRANEAHPNDLKTITPRHLLPTFTREQTWFQSTPDAPLPWRHYRPRSGTVVGSDGHDAYIARRISHFLRVNPHYRDRRQVLSLVFLEPDNAHAVLDALLRVFRAFAAADNLDAVPGFAVTLVNTEKQENALEAFLSGSTKTLPSPAMVAPTRLMRDKVKVTSVPAGTPQPFAHISFVFRSPLDRTHGSFDLAARSGTLWAHGLAATPGRLVLPGANETTFAWGTFAGTAPTGRLEQLAESTLNLVSGMPRDNLAPGKTRMYSTRTSNAFLEDVYSNSVWVVHLDRLLGLEAFAPKSPGGETDKYLIDYEDRADPSQPGLDAITATKWVDPYRLTLRRALTSLGDPTEAALNRVLQLFNSVSGRWALDLIGAQPNELTERVGLSAAIATVQSLDNGFRATPTAVAVMVPLKEVIDALPRDTKPAGRHSDDLLHLHVDLTQRPVAVTCRVIEVKFRTGTDPMAPEAARQQLSTTTAWLDKTFNTEGPGRLFRARDLAELIRGSVTRAEAFGMLPAVRDRGPLEEVLDAVAHGHFRLGTRFSVDGRRLAGDFISIEPESSVAAHRQDLQGSGDAMGHIRLGRPVLEALATGRALPKPPNWQPADLMVSAVDHPAEATASGTPNGQGSAPSGSAPAAATGGPAATDAAAPTGFGVPKPPPDDDTTGDMGNQNAPSGTIVGDAGAGTARQQWTVGADEEVREVAARLDAAFDRYGLSVEPFDPDLVQVGPSLLRFRTRAMGRLSITDVERRERDISREVGATGPVAVGDEPGYVTVDVPRRHRQPVHLDAVLPTLDARPGKPGALSFVSGVAPSGDIRVADLSRLPHLLVAGATGSGKSVFLRGMLLELLRARTPEQLSLVIVDPKRLDFAPFATAPHLRGGRILHDTEEALTTLSDTLASELVLRQPILERAGVSSAAEFYETGGRLEELPQLVIVVDEFADLILGGNDRRAFSELIQRFAQLTRAYGIFLVLATQRPSVDVITGSIKANLSARIAFSLPSSRDSMTVLDQPGAEDLLGDGDLVFYNAGRTERLQAPFVRPADVRSMLNL